MSRVFFDHGFVVQLLTHHPNSLRLIINAFNRGDLVEPVKLDRLDLTPQQFRTAVKHLASLGFEISQKPHAGTYICLQHNSNTIATQSVLRETDPQSTQYQHNSNTMPDSRIRARAHLTLNKTNIPSPAKAGNGIKNSTTCSSYQLNKEDAYKLALKFGIPVDDVKKSYEEMTDWAKAGGKRKHDWYATLSNWIRRNLVDGRITPYKPEMLEWRKQKYAATGELL